MAAHAAYYDEEYFRGVTGLPAVKWIHCKKTETTVRKRLFLRRQILRVFKLTLLAGCQSNMYAADPVQAVDAGCICPLIPRCLYIVEP